MEMEKVKVVWMGVALAALIITSVVVFAIPLGYTATEVRTEQQAQTFTEWVDEPYDSYECETITVKGRSEIVLNSYECSQTDTVCASYEQYCCDTNWYGGCTRYCSRCAGYRYPCLKYRHYLTVRVFNVDDTSGYFDIAAQFLDSNRNEVDVQTQSVWVNSGSNTDKIFYYYDASSTSVGAGNTWVTKYPTKEECGNVIRIRQVQKEVVRMVNVDKEYQVLKKATLYKRWSGQVDYYYHA